eukprot:GEMP01053852.1.p1 GENE.GEMP01053852.1~~GEMP01053852.1.p1  ORF type:complete len:251 (+),score=39.35 GEMP01053852.1:82-834(+)
MPQRPSLLVCIIVAAFMAMCKIYARQILRPLKPFQTLFPWFPAPADAADSQASDIQATLEKQWEEDPQPQTRLFTDEDLCVSYKPIYLAIRGEVFNVTKGEGYYGHNGGYQHLARSDNSMGFTDLSLCASHDSNWTHIEVEAIESWRLQYHKDYIYVGRHVGDYYDELGSEKPLMRSYNAKIKEGKYINTVQKKHRTQYPGCNSSSSMKDSMVWCAFKNKGKPLKDGTPDWVLKTSRITTLMPIKFVSIR